MRRPRARMALCLGLILLLLPASGSGGIVLCIESDGRVALELERGNDSCHSPALPSDCEGVAGRTGDDCCSDLVVHQPASDGVQPRLGSGAVAAIAPLAWPLPSAWGRQSRPELFSTRGTPPITWRRTIVLLV